MMDWSSVDSVAKNDKGQYMAEVGGKWRPAEKVAKNAEGKYMAQIGTGKPSADIPASVSGEEEGLGGMISTPDILNVLRHPVQSAFNAGNAALEAIPKIADIAGGKLSEFATAHGASPEVAGGIGAAVPTIAAAAPLLTPAGDIKALAKGAEALPGAIKSGYEGAADLLGRAKAGVSDLLGTVRGTTAAKGQEEAMSAARKAMEGEAESKSGLSAEEKLRGKATTGIKASLEKSISAEKNAPVPNLREQGETARNEVKKVTDTAAALRRTTADKEFTNVKTLAAQKEASGGRVNTEAVQKPLEELKNLSGGIPALSHQVDQLLNATKGTRSFEELELSRRYLNDIAYSGPLEGYGSVVKNAAREASHALDKAMQEFVPQFKEYKDNYRKMSEPLDAMNTRLGKAIHGTEGGITGDVYAKVEAQDLPGRLFSKAGGIEAMTDMLAGGVKASPEAKAEAGKKVDAMVENWLRESIAGKSTTEAALKQVTSPQMRATLTAAPKVGEKITGELKTLAGREKTVKQLDEFTERAKVAAKKHAEDAVKIKTEIERADNIAKGKSAASQKEALNIYLSTLKSGNIGSPQYKAAIQLIDRAHTLEEKMARARKIAGWIGAGGAVAAEETIRRHF